MRKLLLITVLLMAASPVVFADDFNSKSCDDRTDMFLKLKIKEKALYEKTEGLLKRLPEAKISAEDENEYINIGVELSHIVSFWPECACVTLAVHKAIENTIKFIKDTEAYIKKENCDSHHYLMPALDHRLKLISIEKDLNDLGDFKKTLREIEGTRLALRSIFDRANKKCSTASSNR